LGGAASQAGGAVDGDVGIVDSTLGQFCSWEELRHRLVVQLMKMLVLWTAHFKIKKKYVKKFLMKCVNLPLLPTRFPCLSHHICLHLHKSSTVLVMLDFNITAKQQSAVSCELLHTTRQ